MAEFKMMFQSADRRVRIAGPRWYVKKECGGRLHQGVVKQHWGGSVARDRHVI